MAWFEAFRNEHGFASYNDNRTAVTYDIPLLIVTYLCVLVSIATLIATLGIRGNERWSSTVRAVYAVGVGSIILACLVGHGWQEGEAKISSHYVYRNSLNFEGYVSIKVALESVNVTLDGYYKGDSGPGQVYYAESLVWSDFKHVSDPYRHFLKRGLPEPILRVMEFLTTDEGGFRWGRSFQTSGHFALALLWTSFAFWIITNVLLCSVIVYGAYMFTLTGLTMILACVAYHACQCPLFLTIYFGEVSLQMAYSWSYWLTLTTGCLTTLLGFLLIFSDHFAHEGVSEFFHLEKISEEDTFEMDPRGDSDNAHVVDRRGSIVPPSSERRRSIFLEPCRQPAELIKRQYTSFMPGNLVFASKSPNKNNQFSKLTNPLFNDDNKMSSDSDEEQVRLEMEHVCEDLEVCMSTKKPSLATLKEHRENHANERISSAAGKQHNRYIRNGQPRRGNDQDGIFITQSSEKIFRGPVLGGPRRESCPNVCAVHVTEGSTLKKSAEGECKAANILNSSSSCNVLVSVESHLQPNKDSKTSESGLQESHYQDSADRLDSSENNTRDKNSNSSDSSVLVEIF